MFIIQNNKNILLNLFEMSVIEQILTLNSEIKFKNELRWEQIHNYDVCGCHTNNLQRTNEHIGNSGHVTDSRMHSIVFFVVVNFFEWLNEILHTNIVIDATGF